MNAVVPPVIVLVFSLSCMGSLVGAETHLVDEKPVNIQRLDDGVILLDFGKVAFGNLRVSVPEGKSGKSKFHFGEATDNGRINRKPPGTVRYQVSEVDLRGGKEVLVAPPVDGRNTTHPSAVRLPKEWGVVIPFRWIEIEGWEGKFDPSIAVRQAAYLSAWDDKSADFECSDETLNKIWDLCKYSIKATSFAGIYVDGDRERIPYEADAYLNQLSHYYTDADKQLARDSYDYLMEKPTWPSEWAPHMVFMAHADWMFTGDAEWLKSRYEDLKSKLLLDRVDESGWVKSAKLGRDRRGKGGQRDIVDWPIKECDGYVFTEVNTVVNAFHLEALRRMADLADALGKSSEAEAYRKRHAEGAKRFHAELWMPGKGAYRDGLGTDHAAAHATFIPLAFGLVPEVDREAAVKFLKTRGMVCSVYAAQYLMEAFFDNGAADHALELILAEGDRSWRHMLESGATITWEAWDQKYKPNQDWNHAWGAAPGNLLPRYLLGIEPVKPGWKQVRMAPNVAGLNYCKGKVPTPMGALQVRWTKTKELFELEFELPEGMEALVEVPFLDGDLPLDGKVVSSEKSKRGRLIRVEQAGLRRVACKL